MLEIFEKDVQHIDKAMRERVCKRTGKIEKQQKYNKRKLAWCVLSKTTLAPEENEEKLDESEGEEEIEEVKMRLEPRVYIIA